MFIHSRGSQIRAQFIVKLDHPVPLILSDSVQILSYFQESTAKTSSTESDWCWFGINNQKLIIKFSSLFVPV